MEKATEAKGRTLMAAAAMCATILCQCARAQPCAPLNGETRPSLHLAATEMDQGGVAASVVAKLADGYKHYRTYSDRGFVVYTIWNPDVAPYVFVYRFDTIFVRGHGFRFRYFSEDGVERYAILSIGDSTRVKLEGHVKHQDNVESAVQGLKGATDLAAWVVPELLFGRFPDYKPMYAGREVNCHDCVRAALSYVQGQQTIATIDAGSGVLKRFREIQIAATQTGRAPDRMDALAMRSTEASSQTPSQAAWSEVLLLYEAPEIDREPEALIKELDSESW